MLWKISVTRRSEKAMTPFMRRMRQKGKALEDQKILQGLCELKRESFWQGTPFELCFGPFWSLRLPLLWRPGWHELLG